MRSHRSKYRRRKHGIEAPLCEVTGKRCFDTEKQARHSSKGVGNRIRTYRCEFCNKIHTTKHED